MLNDVHTPNNFCNNGTCYILPRNLLVVFLCYTKPQAFTSSIVYIVDAFMCQSEQTLINGIYVSNETTTLMSLIFYSIQLCYNYVFIFVGADNLGVHRHVVIWWTKPLVLEYAICFLIAFRLGHYSRVGFRIMFQEKTLNEIVINLIIYFRRRKVLYTAIYQMKWKKLYRYDWNEWLKRHYYLNENNYEIVSSHHYWIP